MGDETLEQWAARVAPTMTAGDWRVVASRCFSLEDIDRLTPRDAPGGWVAGKRALLAYRDKVAAGLTDAQVSMLLHALGSPGELGAYRNYYCVFGTFGPAFDGWSEMLSCGVAERGRDINGGRDAVFRATDFGREVARVLKKETSDG